MTRIKRFLCSAAALLPCAPNLTLSDDIGDVSAVRGFGGGRVQSCDAAAYRFLSSGSSSYSPPSPLHSLGLFSPFFFFRLPQLRSSVIFFDPPARSPVTRRLRQRPTTTRRNLLWILIEIPRAVSCAAHQNAPTAELLPPKTMAANPSLCSIWFRRLLICINSLTALLASVPQRWNRIRSSKLMELRIDGAVRPRGCRVPTRLSPLVFFEWFFNWLMKHLTRWSSGYLNFFWPPPPLPTCRAHCNGQLFAYRCAPALLFAKMFSSIETFHVELTKVPPVGLESIESFVRFILTFETSKLCEMFQRKYKVKRINKFLWNSTMCGPPVN